MNVPSCKLTKSQQSAPINSCILLETSARSSESPLTVCSSTSPLTRITFNKMFTIFSLCCYGVSPLYCTVANAVRVNHLRMCKIKYLACCTFQLHTLILKLDSTCILCDACCCIPQVLNRAIFITDECRLY